MAYDFQIFRYLMGGDLGQARDFSTQIYIEQVRDYTERPKEPGSAERMGKIIQNLLYEVFHIHEHPLQTPYPDIVNDLYARWDHPAVKGQMMSVMDAGGPGRPVIDMMKSKGIKPITPIIITGGDKPSFDKDTGMYKVPKRELVFTLLTAYQAGRIRLGVQPLTPRLKEQLENLRPKFDRRTGHDSYEAMVEEIHDDLAIALALAVWYGEKINKTWIDREGTEAASKADRERNKSTQRWRRT